MTKTALAGISTALVITSFLPCLAADKVPVQSSRPLPANTVKVPISTWDFGTRITWFMLTDDKRKEDLSDSFYGSINELKDKQNFLPVKFFADYYFTPYLGIDLTWDQAKVTARKIGGHTDGTFDLKGPIVSIIGRYRNETTCTPYAGIGLAYMLASFDPDYNWQYAIDPETGAYKNGDYFNQNFHPDNPFGFVVSAGAAFNVDGNWDVDLYLRYTSVRLNFTHKTYWGDEETDAADVRLPLDNVALGIGVRYSM
ncbi:MAG: hypothetical protein C0404_09485 [Verrucomicrobia bacterium]|nr:hypothetical protein [Verrucomicrobiota bacterium]